MSVYSPLSLSFPCSSLIADCQLFNAAFGAAILILGPIGLVYSLRFKRLVADVRECTNNPVTAECLMSLTLLNVALLSTSLSLLSLPYFHLSLHQTQSALCFLL